jgi:NAD(P)-dependent dehydrogenase (short-subunit alcohol dehydrogenase family)
MKELEGRVAVITGASTGIGRATALAFAKAGMKVVLASQNEERLQHAVREAQETGADVLGVPTDVGDAAAVQALADRTVEHFGGVHLLMNNAGVFVPGWAWEISQSDWDWVLNVNLMGPLYAIRAFMPYLLAQEEGHVVNVASAGGLMPALAHAPYCTSKHAVVGLSKALRADLASKESPIGVTVVCPGAVATPITSQDSATGPGGVPRGSFNLSPDVAAVWDMVKDFTDAGIPAEDVGTMIVSAVRDNRFWLLPNAQLFHAIFDQELADIKAER